MKKLLLALLILLLAAPVYSMQTPDLEIGGHVRVRGYNMQNMWDFNSKIDSDNWSVFRIRSNIHLKADLGDNISGFIQFANQNYGSGVAAAGENTSDNIFAENAYIDINKFFDLPLTLRLGRQNLMYGSGFVLFDGQSQFASTSLYFDGVKLTWNITDKSKVDLFYVKDQENVRGNNNNDDITLSGAYFTGHCPVIGGQQEVYVLNRDDQGFASAAGGTGKNIWMYGLRLSDKFDCGIDYMAEGAYQNGYYDKTNNIHQDALGYKLQAGYTIPVFENIKPRVFVGYAYLSGDESNTTDNEAWDVYYGGWPQFGDLLAWAYVNLGAGGPATGRGEQYNRMSSTGGEAAYTNLSMPMIGVSTKCGKLSCKVSYTKLSFDETSAGQSDDFGDYYQFQAKYQYSKHLSFATYAAMIDPGDAFVAPYDNAAYETFWETRIDF
ncbi:MAG: alginate export family protein [Deltaproteobacteria bacterium]|nr:alginate export family protein [Deltaproteobacteria bacterium]